MPGRLIEATWAAEPHLDAPPRYRRACRYAAFVPDRLSEITVNLDAETAGVVSEAEDAIRKLNESARPALQPLARLLLRSEAIASSKIEGMQMDTRDLARAEARFEAGGRTGATAIEVMANIDAMEVAIAKAIELDPFTLQGIEAIHRRLMDPVAPRIAGHIRDRQNWIGGNNHNPCGADFVPPPPEYVGELLTDLCEGIDDDRLPPLVQAALVHAQFETIHPFDDGNGRTGRALIHVVLRRRGVAADYVPPISVVLAANRSRYIDGLSAFRRDGTIAWIDHFAAAASTAAHLASRYLEAVADLQDHWRDTLVASAGRLRKDSAVWSLIEALPAHPVVSAPIAVAATRRSKPQVYIAIEQLETAGILIPLGESRRNRRWEAAGLLDLLAGLEAGTPLLLNDSEAEA